MVSFDKDDLQKAIVTLAIEKALIQFDNAAYEIVINKLLTDFECHLLDCYENPQYLKKTLVELYGDSSKLIENLIKENLGEFLTRKGVSKFIHELAQ